MDVQELIDIAATKNASDLQLVVNSPPLLRIHGVLQSIEDMSPSTAGDVFDAFSQLTTVEQRETFEQQMELDFGYTLPSVGRLRCNAALQLNGLSLLRPQ